jgi:hypothetical protein
VNKRLIILVLLAAFLLSAVSPWPAVLTVQNYTGDNIYFRLKYRGEQKYFLTATSDGNAYNGVTGYHVSRFDIVRRTYTGNEVTACGTTTTWARFNLTTNLRLRFTACESMKQYWMPKYWGEPTMEKPNFYNFGTWQRVPQNEPFYGSYTTHFRFLYDVSASGQCPDTKWWPAWGDPRCW